MRDRMPPHNSAEYQRIRRAVRTLNGPASALVCEFCSNRASSWVWIEDTDPMDLDSYLPLCHPCRVRGDWETQELRRREYRRRMTKHWSDPALREEQAEICRVTAPWLGSG